MRSFEYFAPTRVIFGKDSHLQIGDILKEEGCHKVLSITAVTVPSLPDFLMKSKNVLPMLILTLSLWAVLFQIPVFPKYAKALNSAGKRM